jgi:hypothetical protein
VIREIRGQSEFGCGFAVLGSTLFIGGSFWFICGSESLTNNDAPAV